MTRTHWNEMEEPEIVSDEEFREVTRPAKKWYDHRDVLKKAIKLAKAEPYAIIKFYQFSDEDFALVKQEERKLKANLNNHIKKENLPLQVHTKVKGNKLLGYIQYTPNADRLKHSLESVVTDDFVNVFNKRFKVTTKEDDE
jgi:hypothetical protein|tara:strand:- start:114 stop:536 length:423 start_codon:yes stop_codon:yes gene_type:complete